MMKQIQEPKKSSPLMMSSVSTYDNEIVAPESDSGHVIFADFPIIKNIPVPEGSQDIDKFVSKLEEDAGFASEIEKARKLIADKFYSQKSIAQLRLNKGWSQRKLADLLQTSQSHVSKIESGREDLRLSTIQKLADVFNISKTDIINLLPKV